MEPNSRPYQYSGTPTLPIPVTRGPNPRPPFAALRPVLNLLRLNLALCVLTAIVALIVQGGIVDYQLARAGLSPGASLSQVDSARAGLETALWVKLGTMVLLASIYVWRTSRLRRGARRPWVRLYRICVVSLISIGYLIFGGDYPVWMRVEQAIQALVMLTVLYIVATDHRRTRGARRQAQVWQANAAVDR